jgi:hypothetical protein
MRKNLTLAGLLLLVFTGTLVHYRMPKDSQQVILDNPKNLTGRQAVLAREERQTQGQQQSNTASPTPGKYLRWPDKPIRWSWVEGKTGTQTWRKAKVEWVLKEIFRGVELPLSAHDFGGDGFRLDPKEAELFYQSLVKAVEFEPRQVRDYWNRELYYEVGVGKSPSRKVTTLQGLVKDENTLGISVVPMVDPDNEPPDFPDKRPRYCLQVNPVTGDVIFSDYPED